MTLLQLFQKISKLIELSEIVNEVTSIPLWFHGNDLTCLRSISSIYEIYDHQIVQLNEKGVQVKTVNKYHYFSFNPKA